MLSVLKNALLVLIASCSWLAPARALDNTVRLDAFHHDVWTAKDGAPREIEAMAQTTDGWLWLGTTSGLVRFDGIKFRPFVPAPGEQLLGNSITALAARPDGALWIGYTYGGLSVLRDGHLQHVAPIQGNPVGATFAMAFERDGGVWVASTTGLLHYRGGTWQRIGADRGFPGARAEYVYRDHYDRLWASDGHRLFLLDRAAGRFAPVREVRFDPLLLSSPDGRVWFSDGINVQLLPAPAGGWRPLPPAAVHASTYQSLFDRDGNFWVGNCPVGLCRHPPADWHTASGSFATRVGGERLDQPLQMSALAVHSMLEDREGNIWAGTVAGLDRFRHNRLVRVPFPPSVVRLALAADGDGGIWAASQTLERTGRLWRIRDGIAQPESTDDDCSVVTPARSGTVMVGCTQHVELRRGDRVLARYPLPPPRLAPVRKGVFVMADDGSDLWVRPIGQPVSRWHAGAWETAPALVDNAMFAAVDGRGRTWFGLPNNRLAVHDGGRWHEYGERDGVAVGAVRFVDASDGIVIAGDHGMAVLDGARFRMLAVAEGESLPVVSGLAASADGDRWLNSSQGLLHVQRRDWERSVRNPAVPLRFTLWNTLDGYPGSAETIRRTPSAFVAPDGKVWLAGTEGAAWFDPARLHRNPVAPAVHIESIAADGRAYPAARPLALPAGTEHLQIDYTALSYVVPERVRFRYRLAGADSDWQDVGPRRVAYYTNLGPGTYRFEVGAVNEDGVASGIARTAPFTIAPRFFQTAWFVALCALLALLAAYGLYRLRLAQATRRIHAQVAIQAGERERIARTLHDTFLQSLQGLILRLDALATRAAPGSTERGELERVVYLAGQVVDEGRSQVLALRPPDASRPLDTALAEAAEALRTDDTVTVAVTTRGAAAPLPLAVYGEVFLIAREALANALRHAHARRIDVVLDWRDEGLVLMVRDDGRGLSAAVLAHDRPGHWGLSGMRERARKIGATLVVRNRDDGGTGAELLLRLTRHARRRWAWRRRPGTSGAG